MGQLLPNHAQVILLSSIPPAPHGAPFCQHHDPRLGIGPSDGVSLGARLHRFPHLIRYSDGASQFCILGRCRPSVDGVGDWLGDPGLCQPAGNDPTGEAGGAAATADDGCVDTVATVVFHRRRTRPAQGLLPWSRPGGLRARQSPLRPLHPLHPRRGSLVPAGPPQRKEGMRRGIW